MDMIREALGFCGSILLIGLATFACFALVFAGPLFALWVFGLI